MKLKEIKHNHSLTDLLKILIFAILMLAPITAVATRCMYVVCNKNAYQSYSGTNQNTESNIVVTTINNFDYSKTYYLNNSILNSTSETTFSSGTIYFNSVEVITGNPSYENFERLYFYVSANNTTLYYNFNGGATSLNSGSNFLLKVKIRSFNGDSTALNNLNNVLNSSSALYYIDYFTEQQLDNVFEYSVNELENSQLFNWTENTAIYTGVKAMTTQLEITGNVIPILITYWFLLTVIYVIIDIILKLFTVLTHMIGSKQA